MMSLLIIRDAFKLKYLFPIFFILIRINVGQNIPENLNSNIYEFLDRMAIKKIVDIPVEVLPYDVNQIKSFLLEVSENNDKLSFIDRKKLESFKSFYGLNKDRFFLPYLYEKDKFVLSLMPLAGYEIEFSGKDNTYRRTGGIKLSTTYDKIFNGYFLIQDKGEFGDLVDFSRQLSPERGYAFVPAPNGIEFSDIIGGVVLDWDWAKLGLVKDYNRWGSGKFGQIILSDKVNSYPHFKFEFSPINWFRFRYIFGWLNSMVIDSSSYYNSQPGSKLNELRYDFINKYIVANLFTFQPLDYLTFCFGNSFIYSGKNIRLETLIPFSLFKYLDRDVGKGSIADGNGQMFFDLNFNYFQNIRFYGSFFIDVISIRKTLNGDYSENWFAYTVGSKVIDPLINNLEFEIEYSKIDPWVYEHKDITTTYKHLNYQLGHWIGQNADLMNFRIRYYPLWNLSLTFGLQYLRKGGFEDVYYVYNKIDLEKFHFLFPPLRKDFLANFQVKYEPIRSLILYLNYVNSIINDEDIGRTPEFLREDKNFIKIGFEFGFPY